METKLINLDAFRIANFRSIADSNWITASSDAITVLVGQNESGKTSVLQALHLALNTGNITSDDRRIGASDPIVEFRVSLSFAEFDVGELNEYFPHHLSALEQYLKNNNNVVQIKCEWKQAKKADETLYYKMSPSLVNEDSFLKLREENDLRASNLNKLTTALSNEEVVQTPDKSIILHPNDIAQLIHDLLPYSVFFNAESGLLPSSVDIDDSGKPIGIGATAASNFLTIAEIDLPKLMKEDARYRENILNKANKKVSDDFKIFWTQLIGTGDRLNLECEMQYYSASVTEKIGKPHLIFWISDGTTKLFPKQRSLGVRWFVSFYLQLSATKKLNHDRIFILDEPGANLHAKAQADVLKLINHLRKDITIFYSTHSPQMIEYEKLHRVRAVQRDGTKEDSPTVVIDGYLLGSASSDTLSPILAAMGTDMSKQTVIQKHRNVLLEEISGYYYLKAFWQLTNTDEIVHFIAASGVNKLSSMVNMFLGWGLEFIVAVDDDKAGRDVFKQLKRDLFADQDDLSNKCLLKIPGCTSIEEAFSTVDFAKFVLKKLDAQITDGNAEYLKRNQISKPVTALQFLLTVESKEISLEMLEHGTQDKIKKIVIAISNLLKNQEKS